MHKMSTEFFLEKFCINSKHQKTKTKKEYIQCKKKIFGFILATSEQN
eukprot:COSAG01_NODE_1716_length_9403_cov_4.038697_6_plen_47_part_00